VILAHRFLDGFWFKDDFIAAKKRSALLRQVLKDLSRIAKEGKWPYPDYNITTVNLDTLVITFPSIVETLINIYHK
jgi:hypothetical protein